MWGEWLRDELVRNYVPPVWEVWIWETQMGFSLVACVVNLLWARHNLKRIKKLEKQLLEKQRMSEENPFYKDYLMLKGGLFHDTHLPEGWAWQWQRWCMENCNSIGQCDWDKKKCPFAKIEIGKFTVTKDENLNHSSLGKVITK